MDRSLKWIFSAVLLVLGIVLLSRGFAGIPAAAQSNILGATDPVELSAESLDSGTPLRVGSEVEVYRFRLNADAPFTLRYLTLSVQSQSLDEASLKEVSHWKIYTAGRNPQLVGQGERFNEQSLLVRMSDSRTQAYLGKKGKNDFVVMTEIKKNASDARISIGLSAENWVWVPYSYTESWVTLQEKWGAQAITGLPSEVLEKNLEL